MKFIKKSFGRKLAFTYGILFALIFSGVYFYASHAVEERALAHLEESLTVQARLLSHVMPPSLFKEQSRDGLNSLIHELGGEAKGRLTVIDPEGVVVADSELSSEKLSELQNHKYRPEVEAALGDRVGKNIRYSQTLKMKMLYVAIPLKKDNSIIGVMRIAWPLHTVHEILGLIERPLLAGSVFGIFSVLLLSFFLSRSVSERVGRLTEAAKQYTEGKLNRKIFIRSNDELELLARTMNQMAATIRERIREIDEERAKFSAVLTHMTEGVLAVDCHNKILIVNPSAEKIFDIREEDARGRGFIEVIRNKKIDEIISRAIMEHAFFSTEIELPRLGTKILRVSVLGISKSAGGVAGILVISDISEIRRLENVRREFVANVSHELRTPLTSIRGFIETLLGGTVSDPVRGKEFLRMMEEDACRLTKLIDDLLELSRIEAKELSLKPEVLSLAEQIHKVLLLLRPHLEEKKITLEDSIAGKSPLRVLADPGGLRQVLMNLLDNAIKFNKENGHIVLRAEEVPGFVKVSVQDTGCGIPPEAISHVFERFFRVDKGRSRDLGGTGLGLSIVKHIVEAHGGKVSCESKPEEGSKFTFTLPAVLPPINREVLS